MPLDTRQLHSTLHLLSTYPHLPQTNTSWQTTTAIGEFFHALQTLEHKISSTLGFDFAVNLPHSLGTYNALSFFLPFLSLSWVRGYC